MAPKAKHVVMATGAFVILALIVLTWLVASVMPGEKGKHERNFVDTQFTVRRRGEGPYECAEARNCQCANVIGVQPACGNLHTNGVCDNGCVRVRGRTRAPSLRARHAVT